MGRAKHRSSLGIAEPTWRDRQRDLQGEVLAKMYAQIDSDIADALGEDVPLPHPPLEA